MIAAVVLSMLFAVGPFQAVDEEGLRRIVSAQRGNIVIVNVWATWCAPCRAEMPALIALEKRRAAKGVRLILISANEAEEEPAARKFLEGLGVSSPPYIKRVKDDQKFIDSIDPKWSGALPATFVYDRFGKRVRSSFGELDIRDLEALIKRL